VLDIHERIHAPRNHELNSLHSSSSLLLRLHAPAFGIYSVTISPRFWEQTLARARALARPPGVCETLRAMPSERRGRTRFAWSCEF
jgi:hypothetical protein